MDKIILLVLTDADVEELDVALGVLYAKPAEGIWVIHNPHLGVTNEKVLSEFDKDIVALDKQVNAAIAREDFDAAKAYRDQRNGKKVDRDLALREGWQKTPMESRQSAYDKLFSGFNKNAAKNVLISCTREVYRPEQAFELLQAMRTMWPAPLIHGQYIVAWPGSLAPSKSKPVLGTRDARRKELSESKFAGVNKAAKFLGLSTAGKSMESIIDDIIEQEYAGASA